MQARPEPFLRWAGGKRLLFDTLSKHLPAKIGTYFEPCLGGGAMFFGLWAERRFRRAVLSDLNPELVDCYRALRDEPEAVRRELDEHVRMNSEAYYYATRNVGLLFLASRPLAWRAARTIYLNKTNFNGLYRQNRKGEFNASWGKLKNPTIYEAPNLEAVSTALAGSELVADDFERVISQATAGDAVYFDPPYFSRTGFTTYTGRGFGLRDHERLAEVATALVHRGVHVLISNSNCEETREIFSATGLSILSIEARRSINCDGKGRGKVSELVVVGTPTRAEKQKTRRA